MWPGAHDGRRALGAVLAEQFLEGGGHLLVAPAACCAQVTMRALPSQGLARLWQTTQWDRCFSVLAAGAQQGSLTSRRGALRKE